MRLAFEPQVVNKLRHLRGPGESYSDVIIRVAKGRVPTHASSNSTMLVWPVMGMMTPGDFTTSLLPSIRKKYTRSVSKIA
jgi:hypothetical protein